MASLHSKQGRSSKWVGSLKNLNLYRLSLRLKQKTNAVYSGSLKQVGLVKQLIH